MRRDFEEISDEEWSNHNFKPSRVLKRPHRSPQQPAGRPPPPIDSFRYDPKPSSAVGTSNGTTVVLSDDDDFDLGKGAKARRAENSSRVLKRPQHKSPPRRATASTQSSRHNNKPPKAAIPVALSDEDFDPEDEDFGLPASRRRPRPSTGRRLATASIDLSDEEEDLDLTFEDSDLADDDSDLADDDSDHPAPSSSRPRRTTGRRFVIEDDDDSDGSVAAGVVELGDEEEDDGVNWSELENEDDEDGDYNGQSRVKSEEVEGDVVGKALRRCSRISVDLRQELYGSSARNCESYAETDASTVRIVTQEDVDAACTSEDLDFNPVLKPYQLVGVNFLLLLHRKGIGGAILADEMGLGKTVQAVTYLNLLQHLYNDPGPHLVVCPASVLENWERELKKWCPAFSIIMFHGAGRVAFSKELNSLGKAGCPAPFNVLLVGYSLFERRSAQQKDDRKALKRWKWSCVLMDEAHVLKDKGSFRWRNLMAVAQHARQRLMLTGTPLQNDLHELWSLLEFMMPDIFATGDVDLKKLLNSEDHELISRIKSILGPFILRRLKSDVMQQLVPKMQHVNFVSMGSEQSKAYNGALNDYRAIVDARTAKSSVQFPKNVVGLIPKRQISNYFMQLRKIANHPLLIRRIYSDKDVDRIARLTYPKGAFGFRRATLHKHTRSLVTLAAPAMAVMVEITQSMVLEPSKESARGGGKKVPLIVFDRASTDGYIPAVFAWNAPAPTNAALKAGLVAAVARFPHLAGRFAADDHGRKCFHLNDAGVLVVEATADADLADALAHDVSAHINELYPKAEKERANEPIFQAQLTRYACGGLVIGTACHHQVADGQSMSVFYTAWASAVRTDSAVLPSPFVDRSATVVPRSPPKPAYDHRNIEFKGELSWSHSYGVLPMDRIKNLAVHFPDEFVADLKARVGTRCSTFQCLLAHAWKKITAARDLAPDDFTQVRVAVNCRGRAKPPVPMDFFGNMVLWAFPRMQVRDLLSSSYPAVVGAIRDAVALVDDEYIQSFIDFGEAERGVIEDGGEELASTAATPGTMFCPDLEVDSWLGFRFHDLDFGCGPPCAFLPPDLPIEGIMIFVPSCDPKGGVDLFMALDDEHVQAFKQICYSMD